MRRPTVLGLLGGIGSGKSTIAQLFAECGAEVLDADRIAHEVLEREDVRKEIRAEFGPGVFDASGAVARAALAQVVFGDANRLARLNDVVHPRILAVLRGRIEELRASGEAPVAVLDAPLLLETGLDALCDRLVFVDASPTERLRRVAAHRNWTADQLRRREKCQKPVEEKRSVADDRIVNEGPIEAVRDRVRAIFRDLTRD